MTLSAYARTLREIFEHVDYGRNRQHPYTEEVYNLDRVRDLARLMGDPQDTYPLVHIAGSKGKGSTSAMTESILRTAGHHTGLYTSPHLHTFRERMRVDGELIPHERLVELWQQARPAVEAVPGISTFEIITVLAWLYFASAPVDWAVIEVGLGGRLDATNIITPRACAITALSLEHTDLLGNHITDIAAEKAGIIKPGVPVVTGPQPPEAMEVLRRTAQEMDAPLTVVGEDWRWRIQEQTPQGLLLDIYGPSCTIENIHLPLTGAHQAINATVAVALTQAALAHAPLSPELIRQGLENTYWPGRLELLAQQPTLLLDSAHNQDSATRLRNALSTFPHRRLILLFGVSIDKDVAGMMDALGEAADAIVLTRSFHPRAASAASLEKIVRPRFPEKAIYLSDDVAPGLDLALSLAGPDDLILATGSIFVVAATREAWRALHPDAFPPHDWVHFAEPIDAEFTPKPSQPA